MLRRHHHMPEAYLWVLLWFVLALLLLIAESALLPQPAIASVVSTQAALSTFALPFFCFLQ